MFGREELERTTVKKWLHSEWEIIPDENGEFFWADDVNPVLDKMETRIKELEAEVKQYKKVERNLKLSSKYLVLHKITKKNLPNRFETVLVFDSNKENPDTVYLDYRDGKPYWDGELFCVDLNFYTYWAEIPVKKKNQRKSICATKIAEA